MNDEHQGPSDLPQGCDCVLEPPQSPLASASSSSPSVDPPNSTESHAAASAAAPEAPPDRPRRALKLVVSLQPREGQRYNALLALGADGCDPLLRSIDVDAPTAVLALVPALIAEAEARWQTQPRYPSARPGKAPRSTPAPSRPTDVPPPDPPTPKSAGSGPTEPRLGTKPTGQLSLFS